MYHKDQPRSVGKYTSPMVSPMGLIFPSANSVLNLSQVQQIFAEAWISGLSLQLELVRYGAVQKMTAATFP